MTIATVPVYDATHGGIGALPQGTAAGYTTGSGAVPWTAADWAAHPGAVRICQDPGASDVTADVLDVETGAATTAEVARWAGGAAAAYATGKRPGQRHPAIYCSLNTVTPVVNALIAGGITSGVNLWIANWNLTEAEAAALIQVASGPFPVIAVQYGNRGPYDVSVASGPWLAAVSGPPAAFHGEYVGGGQFSLAALAAKLGVPASTLLRMTACHFGTFGDALAGYLNAVHGGILPVTAPMPKGIRFWVD